MIDPDEIIELTLDADKARDEASRPVFFCRQLSRRRRTKLMRLVEQAVAAESADKYEETDDLLAQIFALGLVGWRNVVDEAGKPLDFAASVVADASFVAGAAGFPAKIPVLCDLLTWNEMWELERRIARETLLSEAAKKNSASPAPSPPETSAKTAGEVASSETK